MLMQPQAMVPMGFDPNAYYMPGLAMAQNAWMQPQAPQVAWGQADFAAAAWQMPQEVNPYAASYLADVASQFMQELGIDPSEDIYFGWIAEYGLQSDVLPPKWEIHVDPSSNSMFYVNAEDGLSTWDNPLSECLRQVISCGRGYLQAPSDGYFEEQKMALWALHKQNLEGWHGPHVDEEGREYFANSDLGISSWSDPRHATQYIFEIQSGLLDALEEMLPSYVEEMNLPGFGLLDRGPPVPLMTVRGDSFADLECPTSPGNTTPRSRITSPEPRARTPLTAKMDRPEMTDAEELRRKLFKDLDSFFYIYKDDEEAQRLLIGRKLKERRLRKQRGHEELAKKLREEVEEMRRQEEERQKEEAARREAAEQERKEKERRVLEEKKRKEEEERRIVEEKKRREDEAKKEEERRLQELQRKKLQEEEAAKKAKETRERLLATMHELAQSRDGWVLKNAIAEGESVGLDLELQPLREALKEVQELRKAALLKARKAQEKLANDFKTAKEAQDFGGPVLAAQWRAAVKEVQKPFVMPE